jgi:hypothetical protein
MGVPPRAEASTFFSTHDEKRRPAEPGGAFKPSETKKKTLVFLRRQDLLAVVHAGLQIDMVWTT